MSGSLDKFLKPYTESTSSTSQNINPIGDDEISISEYPNIEGLS